MSPIESEERITCPHCGASTLRRLSFCTICRARLGASEADDGEPEPPAEADTCRVSVRHRFVAGPRSSQLHAGQLGPVDRPDRGLSRSDRPLVCVRDHIRVPVHPGLDPHDLD